MATPRVVIVRRSTEFDELLARHSTVGQAEFVLRTRGQDLAPIAERHRSTVDAIAAVRAAIPGDWHRGEVERCDLARFLFGPDDIIVVVGQDGLVPNVAKYLRDQPVLGVDPLPGANAGILVPHGPAAVPDLLADVAAGRARILDRTMVQVSTDDAQELTALNEVYIGQPGQQSARYDVTWRGTTQAQSSSGLIIGTGTGATGWCASIARASHPGFALPAPTDSRLAWFVREPWPSRTTGTSLDHGVLEDDHLELRVTSDRLVAFGDGMEHDRLLLGWGQRIRIGRAARTLRSVV